MRREILGRNCTKDREWRVWHNVDTRFWGFPSINDGLDHTWGVWERVVGSGRVYTKAGWKLLSKRTKGGAQGTRSRRGLPRTQGFERNGGQRNPRNLEWGMNLHRKREDPGGSRDGHMGVRCWGGTKDLRGWGWGVGSEEGGGWQEYRTKSTIKVKYMGTSGGHGLSRPSCVGDFTDRALQNV